jgi:hypothetical protein
MSNLNAEKAKALVLEAFDTLFNESQSGLPMFGATFPVYAVSRTQPTSMGELQYASDW